MTSLVVRWALNFPAQDVENRGILDFWWKNRAPWTASYSVIHRTLTFKIWERPFNNKDNSFDRSEPINVLTMRICLSCKYTIKSMTLRCLRRSMNRNNNVLLVVNGLNIDPRNIFGRFTQGSFEFYGVWILKIFRSRIN